MKVKRLFIFISAAFMMLISLTALHAAEDDQMLFNEGNSFYFLKRYEEARADYETLIRMGYNDPALYFNLASTYMFLDEPGKAALYLYRAKRIEPRNDYIDNNLSVIASMEEMINDPGKTGATLLTERDMPLIKGFVKGFSIMSKNEIAMLIMFFYFLFFAWFLFRKFLKPGAQRFFAGALGTASYFMAMIFIFVFIATFYYENAHPESVVLETVELMTSPADGETYFSDVTVTAGTLVELNREYNGWGEVTLVKTGDTGWVKLDLIERI